MSRPTIHQVVIGAGLGDAITSMALALRDGVRRTGATSEVYAHHLADDMRHEVLPIEQAPVGSRRDVLVYHASFGIPRVTRWLLARRERIVVVYHNITPWDLFIDVDPDFAAGLYWGRHELELLRDRAALDDRRLRVQPPRSRAPGLPRRRGRPGRPRALALAPRARPDPALAAELRDRYPAGFVVSVGQLLPHKRIERVVQAMHMVQWVHERPVGLVVVGHHRLAPYQRALHRVARELNVRDVWFTGPLPDAGLATVYRAASVYASASAHEGLALPPLEAMSFGVPVVALGSGALPDTLGGAGLLLPEDAGPVLLGEALVEVLATCDAARGARAPRPRPGGRRRGRRPRGRVHRPPPGSARRMRILYVVQRYGEQIVGGSEAAARSFAEHLAGRGHEVEVLTSCAQSYVDWANAYPPGTERLHGVTVHRLPVSQPRTPERFGPHPRVDGHGHPRPAPLFVQRRWAKHMGPDMADLAPWLIANCGRFDVAVFMTYLYSTATTGLPAVAGRIPTVLQPTAHDEPPIWLRLYDTIFRLPDAFLFFTPEERDVVRRRFGIEPAGETIGIGIDLQEATDVAGFRRRHDLGDDPYLLYVGRIDAIKGSREAHEFFDVMQRRRPSRLKFVFVGERIGEMPSHPDVVFTGFLDEADKRNALAGALALVQPSRFESFSIVLCESWVQRRPAIVHADSEVMSGQARRSGGAIPYRGFAEFEAAVAMLLERPDLADQMGRCGRAYVEEMYGWDRVTDGFERAVELARARFQRRTNRSAPAPEVVRDQPELEA